MNRLLFVYGSLKKGFHNHSLIEHSKLVSKYTLPPKFTMVSLGAFPGVIPTGNTEIEGEIYELDQRTWERVERLEGYPRFYNRMEVGTDLGEVSLYILPEEYLKYGVVESGVWE